jgi:calcineurin-like phosphoesterase family protein
MYFISDFHFCHRKVIDYAHRPFANIEEMNETMVEKYNSVVGANDSITIVGDFAFGGIENFINYAKRLNGVKTLIRGNHDKSISDNEVLNAGFVEVAHSKIITSDKLKIGISHFPFRKRGEMPGKYDISPNNCDVLIHGHVHQHWKVKKHTSGKMMINVSVEAIEYKPITLDDVHAIIKKQHE